MLLLLALACSGSVPLDTADPTDDTASTIVGDDTGTTDPDVDGDGFPASIDCDDDDFRVNPEATEACDGVDNDCDLEVDEGVTQTYYEDLDGDGYGDPGAPVESCSPVGYADNALDCDDTDINVSPTSGADLADGIDNDCDGAIDEDEPPDACAKEWGRADWWVGRYEVSAADSYPLILEANATICDVTCDVAWATFDGLAHATCDEAYEPTPFDASGEIRACVTVTSSDPGSIATCTAHTSAGDIAIELVWAP